MTANRSYSTRWRSRSCSPQCSQPCDIVDTPYNYILRWMWAAGAIVWLAIAWTFWRGFADNGRWNLATSRSFAAVITMLAAWLAITAPHADFPAQADQRTLARIAPSVRKALRDASRPGSYRGASRLPLGPRFGRPPNDRDPRGYSRSARPTGPSTWSEKRTRSLTPARSVVVVALDDTIDKYRHDRTYRSIANYDPTLHQRTRVPHNRRCRGPTRVSCRTPGAEALVRHPPSRSDACVRELDKRGAHIQLFLKTVHTG